MPDPKRLAYPEPPWPYPEGLSIVCPYAPPSREEPMADSEMLLLAANLNFPQLLSGPLLVARSGKTSDLRSNNWTKTTPVVSGLAAWDAVCDCVPGRRHEALQHHACLGPLIGA